MTSGIDYICLYRPSESNGYAKSSEEPLHKKYIVEGKIILIKSSFENRKFQTKCGLNETEKKLRYVWDI